MGKTILVPALPLPRRPSGGSRGPSASAQGLADHQEPVASLGVEGVLPPGRVVDDQGVHEPPLVEPPKHRVVHEQVHREQHGVPELRQPDQLVVPDHRPGPLGDVENVAGGLLGGVHHL